MNLSLKEAHLSIQCLNAIELPDFTVVTGLNGSGKTHLLDAIKEAKITCDEIPIQQITHIDFLSVLSQGGSGLVIQTAIDQFLEGKGQDGKVKSKDSGPVWKNVIVEIFRKHFEIIDGATSHLVFDESTIDSLPPLWKIKKEDVAGKVWSKIQEFMAQIDKEVFENPEFKKFPYHQIVIESYKQNAVIYASGRSLVCNEFFDIVKGDTRLKRLSKLFNDYVQAKENYALDQFNNHGRSESKENLQKEYSTRFPEPWDVLNRVLEDVKSFFPDGRVFDFTITNPDSHPVKPGTVFEAKTVSDLTNELIGPDQLSSGEQVVLMLITLAFDSENSFMPPSLFLLDEIEATLHPSMIKTMLKIIRKVFTDRGAKVILATHSPTTVSLVEEESIYVIHHGNPEIKLEKRSKQEALGILTQGYMTMDDILKFEEVPESKVIISEGKNYDYLLKAREYFDPDNQVGILKVNAGGSGELRSLFNLVRRLNTSKKFFFVWDCDYREKEQRDGQGNIIKDTDGRTLYEPRNLDFLTNDNTSLCKGFIFEKNQDSCSERGIENLFDRTDLREYQSEFDHKGPKNKKSHWKFIEEHASLDLFKNFRLLFDFIRE